MSARNKTLFEEVEGIFVGQVASELDLQREGRAVAVSTERAGHD